MKLQFLFIGWLVVLLNSCQQISSPSSETTEIHTAVKITPTDFDSIFDANEAYGTFVLYDLDEDKSYIYNESRADSAFIPASTFKIPNSLICLEEGAIKDEKEIIPWDGVDRWATVWDQDHNLEMALKNSAYWFYQVLTRRVGETQMQYWIDALQYGNQNINGGIDQFWLTGDLRISAKAQVAFLKKLQANNLPFSQRTKDIVRKIMIREQTPDYTLYAKTGWGVPEGLPQIGWYVGYLVTSTATYFFAMNIEIQDNGDVLKRQGITKAVFAKLGIEIEGK